MLLIIFCNYDHDEFSREEISGLLQRYKLYPARLQITLKHGSRDTFADIHFTCRQGSGGGCQYLHFHTVDAITMESGVCELVGAYLLQPRLDDGDRDASTVLLHVIVASLLIEVSPQSCHVALCISQHSTKGVAKIVIQPNDLRACWPCIDRQQSASTTILNRAWHSQQ